MPLPLLQTKLYAPSPRPHLVQRDHLLARLHDEMRCPLTLVCAPAGFGKTTLVCDWITKADHAVAWLSLDEDDNDPTRFLAYLVAALRTRQTNLGETALSLLAAPQAPPAKVILTLLLNDLAELTTPLVLVLDDYHIITAQAIHEAAIFLVDHLPPHIHLVMTSRMDPPLPLARWRARNQLTEIRADDLRFRTDEAVTFLNGVMGLRLTAVQVATLETRTEGWIAGLQLAALSMQGREDVSGFLQAFSGSHRHVLSYLIEEVLNRCPAGTLAFLLHTSILERLSAPLCDAVTDSSDSQQLLEKVEQANLFLIPLDDERVWYRYHHLFADVLRARLQQTLPQLVPALYRRASAWCAQQDQLPTAIHYALATQDFLRAAQLLERFDITFSPDPAFQTMLTQWVNQLPDDVVQAHPRLCVIHAWLLFAQFQVGNALRRVAQAEVALQQQPYADPEQTRTVRAEILALDALLTTYTPMPDYAKTIAAGEEVLATVAPQRAGLLNLAAVAIAAACVKQGNLARALVVLTQAVARAQASNEIYMTLATGINLVMAHRVAGALRNAITTCRQVIDWMIEQVNATHPMLGALYATLADLLREINNLHAAAQYAHEGVVACDRWATPLYALLSRFVLLRVKQAQGDWEGVWTLWQAIDQQYGRALPAPFLEVAKLQLLLQQGRTAETLAWFEASSWQEAMSATVMTSHGFVYTYEYNRVVRAQVALARARATTDQTLFQDLIDHLRRQQQAAVREGLHWLRIKVHCLQALAYDALAASDEATEALHQALALAEPEGYVRVFVDEGEAMRLLILDFGSWIAQQPLTEQNRTLAVYGNKLLAAFGSEQAKEDKTPSTAQPQIQNLMEPLSDRELEVLQLVALGLSNSQIAVRLIVTTSTVKTHLNHIFGKLAVQSRTQAVARAQELGLLTH